MEAISAALQPYKDVVGTIASVVTIGQFFSGAVICRDIYKKNSTKGISAMPFIGGVVIGVLVLKYALMLQDTAMLVVNAVAITLNLIYSAFYYHYSQDRWNEVQKLFSAGAALIAVLFAYELWENKDLLEFRYGFIVTVLMLALLASPLIELGQILEKKDASSIPFPLTFMGTLVSFLWLLYGLILQNNFMILQNIIGFILCIVQLALYFIFPGEVASRVGDGQKKSTKRD